MLRVAVSMLSLASCLGDSIGNERLVGQVGLVEKGESRAAALAGFQKFADGLVAQYMADGKAPDNTTRAAIEQVITFIDGFFVSFNTSHYQDLEAVNNCPGRIESCYPSLWETWNHSNVARLANLTEEARRNHETCRRREDECPQTINTYCSAYDTYRQSENASLPVCVGAGHLGEDYIKADTDDNLGHMEDCLETFKGWFDPLYNKYLLCNRGDDDCTADGRTSTIDCDTEQSEFEVDHCELSMAENGSCTRYSECFARENADCATDGTVCTNVAIQAGARKADNETGERIKCLLNVLLNSTDENKPADLAACVNATYDTSYFDIVCPLRIVTKQTAPFDCSDWDHIAPPCSETFLNVEYLSGSFPNSAAVRCNCQPCVAFGNLSQRPAECPQYDATSG